MQKSPWAKQRKSQGVLPSPYGSFQDLQVDPNGLWKLALSLERQVWHCTLEFNYRYQSLLPWLMSYLHEMPASTSQLKTQWADYNQAWPAHLTALLANSTTRDSDTPQIKFTLTQPAFPDERAGPVNKYLRTLIDLCDELSGIASHAKRHKLTNDLSTIAAKKLPYAYRSGHSISQLSKIIDADDSIAESLIGLSKTLQQSIYNILLAAGHENKLTNNDHVWAKHVLPHLQAGPIKTLSQDKQAMLGWAASEILNDNILWLCDDNLPIADKLLVQKATGGALPSGYANPRCTDEVRKEWLLSCLDLDPAVASN